MMDGSSKASNAKSVARKRRYGKLTPRVHVIAHARTTNIAAAQRTRGNAWTQIRNRHIRHEPLCRHCALRGLVREAKEVDHIVPVVLGGTDDDSNLQSLCLPCHVAKTNVEQAQRREGWTPDVSTQNDAPHSARQNETLGVNTNMGGSDSWK